MITISAELRDKKGKSFSRKLRRSDNRIPSVIYGAKKSTLHISLDHDTIFNIQKNNDFNDCTLTIKINNKTYLVSVHAVQRHCFKKKILHVDFLYKKN